LGKVLSLNDKRAPVVVLSFVGWSASVMRTRTVSNFVIFMVSAVGLVTGSITELALLGRVIVDVTAAIEAFDCDFHRAIMVGTGLLSSRSIDSCLSISSCARVDSFTLCPACRHFREKAKSNCFLVWGKVLFPKPQNPRDFSGKK
jgi:hypothetical protein